MSLFFNSYVFANSGATLSNMYIDTFTTTSTTSGFTIHWTESATVYLRKYIYVNGSVVAQVGQGISTTGGLSLGAKSFIISPSSLYVPGNTATIRISTSAGNIPGGDYPVGDLTNTFTLPGYLSISSVTPYGTSATFALTSAGIATSTVISVSLSSDGGATFPVLGLGTTPAISSVIGTIASPPTITGLTVGNTYQLQISATVGSVISTSAAQSFTWLTGTVTLGTVSISNTTLTIGPPTYTGFTNQTYYIYTSINGGTYGSTTDFGTNSATIGANTTLQFSGLTAGSTYSVKIYVLAAGQYLSAVSGTSTAFTAVNPIWYPSAAVALTPTTTGALSVSGGGYVVTASSDMGTGNSLAYLLNYDLTDVWNAQCFGNLAFSANNYTGSATTTLTGYSAGSVTGAWVQIRLPSAIKIQAYATANYADAGTTPGFYGAKNSILCGSNDGTSWVFIDEHNNTSTSYGSTSTQTQSIMSQFTVTPPSVAYSYYRYICRSVITGTSLWIMKEFRVYG